MPVYKNTFADSGASTCKACQGILSSHWHHSPQRFCESLVQRRMNFLFSLCQVIRFFVSCVHRFLQRVVQRTSCLHMQIAWSKMIMPASSGLRFTIAFMWAPVNKLDQMHAATGKACCLLKHQQLGALSVELVSCMQAIRSVAQQVEPMCTATCVESVAISTFHDQSPRAAPESGKDSCCNFLCPVP